MSNVYHGYPLFHDVSNPTLRSYNRANIFINIKDRYGIHLARKYAQRFKKTEQVRILTMMERFHTNGFEQTRRDILRNKEV